MFDESKIARLKINLDRTLDLVDKLATRVIRLEKENMEQWIRIQELEDNAGIEVEAGD